MKDFMKDLYKMEDMYARLYSQAEEDAGKIVYVDTLIKDMYTHNFTFYKDIDLMKRELKEQTKHLDESFIRAVFAGEVNKEYYQDLSIKPLAIEYDIYMIETEKYVDLPMNEDVSVLKVINDQILKDAVSADIEANKNAMPIEFLNRRILRKSICYMDQRKSIDFYVGYYQGEAVGTVEFFYQGDYVKIEDFDVADAYQKKGIGTTMIRQMLKDAYEDDIPYAYLLTDNSESAKEMYQKCGFQLVGKKGELFFQPSQPNDEEV